MAEHSETAPRAAQRDARQAIPSVAAALAVWAVGVAVVTFGDRGHDLHDRGYAAQRVVKVALQDRGDARFDGLVVQADGTVCGRVGLQGGGGSPARFIVLPTNQLMMEGPAGGIDAEWAAWCGA